MIKLNSKVDLWYEVPNFYYFLFIKLLIDISSFIFICALSLTQVRLVRANSYFSGSPFFYTDILKNPVHSYNNKALNIRYDRS